ncbi:Lar family restriction alleviation protein [Mesorhizobium sp. WSM2239]|uniref:Lar family restriction alleviation protein n=2 Tax=unclassified Mesorhizobium TaxID=325217 RepID=A0AAU8D3V3_9HYPH
MPTEEQALKPCPFCGSRNVAQGASRDRISVWCFCGAQGPSVPFPENNIDPVTPIKQCYAAWNRRALEAAATLTPSSGEPEWLAEMERGLPERLQDTYTRWNNPPSPFLPDGAEVMLKAADAIVALIALVRANAAERDHWKANHDEMVARNAVLRDRPDLPVDRLPALQRVEARAEAAERKLAEAGKVLKQIADPLTAMRNDAEAAGNKLSGMAHQIANDPAYIKQIARQFLESKDVSQ